TPYLRPESKWYQLSAPNNLPKSRESFRFDHTALGLSAPKRVRFRYRLEGADANWRDAGIRREAFYTNLRPGAYRFQVIASNNDGIWNEEGAVCKFTILPAFYQTRWFFLLCVAAFGCLVFMGYKWRVYHVRKLLHLQFEERLSERMRMARELHDTFLQTVQGSKLVADDALEQSGDTVRMSRAMEQISVWLGQAVSEGRAALNSLRTPTAEKNDLADAFRRATETCVIPGSMAITFSVVGDARDLQPIVRDEIYRIGYEAIRNACLHSKASRS